ncbi:MAG: DUF5678 domain-containing protein [Bacteroidales bacterium]|jgi:hypothetical protein|nr:DUF5678 domain-containing protein [Bacteroidales bacterium]
MLNKEFKFYLDHQDELLKKYEGRFIGIVGEDVVGDYDDFEQAVFDLESKYKLGTFLVQECTAGEDAYTQTFHSKVIFA